MYMLHAVYGTGLSLTYSLAFRPRYDSLNFNFLNFLNLFNFFHLIHFFPLSFFSPHKSIARIQLFPYLIEKIHSHVLHFHKSLNSF
jgi:hypothetical protein